MIKKVIGIISLILESLICLIFLQGKIIVGKTIELSTVICLAIVLLIGLANMFINALWND